MNQNTTITVTLPGYPDYSILVEYLRRYLAPQQPATISASTTPMPQSTLIVIVTSRFPVNVVWWLELWHMIDVIIGPDSILPATMPTTITAHVVELDGRVFEYSIDRSGHIFTLGVEDTANGDTYGMGPPINLQ